MRLLKSMLRICIWNQSRGSMSQLPILRLYSTQCWADSILLLTRGNLERGRIQIALDIGAHSVGRGSRYTDLAPRWGEESSRQGQEMHLGWTGDFARHLLLQRHPGVLQSAVTEFVYDSCLEWKEFVELLRARMSTRNAPTYSTVLWRLPNRRRSARSPPIRRKLELGARVLRGTTCPPMWYSFGSGLVSAT